MSRRMRRCVISTGRFSDAVATAEMALQLATDSRNRQMADVIRGHLEFYRAEQPFRDVR